MSAPPTDDRPPFLAFTTKSKSPGKQPVLRSLIQARQAASLGKGSVPKSLVAIWDTGASATCVSPKISRELGLSAISMTTVHAAGNTYDSPVYKIDVLLPNGLIVTDIRATEAKNILGADMLIGMDIITTGDLSITNADGDTWFSFRFPPAAKHIDYAAEANATAQRPQPMQNRQSMLKHLRKKGIIR